MVKEIGGNVIRTLLKFKFFKWLYRYFEMRRGRKKLEKIAVEDSIKNLTIPVLTLNLDELFNDNAIAARWKELSQKIKDSEIGSGTGGVNIGDRRALFYLVSALQPESVLEIGTHIGASTVWLASGLQNCKGNSTTKEGQIVTVDIIDVNDRVRMPWRQFGVSQSPQCSLQNLSLDQHVKFVANSSLDFFETTDSKFDLIFLDGDHDAATVYRELPLAMTCLSKRGVILLHDYYPDGKPIQRNGLVIPGPFLAIQRLLTDGAKIRVIPLGDLPWECKAGSNRTSLALVTGI